MQERMENYIVHKLGKDIFFDKIENIIRWIENQRKFINDNLRIISQLLKNNEIKYILDNLEMAIFSLKNSKKSIDVNAILRNPTINIYNSELLSKIFEELGPGAKTSLYRAILLLAYEFWNSGQFEVDELTRSAEKEALGWLSKNFRNIYEEMIGSSRRNRPRKTDALSEDLFEVDLKTQRQVDNFINNTMLRYRALLKSIGESSSEIDRLSNQISEVENNVMSKFDKFNENCVLELKNISDKYKSLVDDHNKEMDGLRAAAKTEAATMAAETFWKEKRDNHSDMSRKSMIWLFLCMVFSVFVLPVLISFISSLVQVDYGKITAMGVVVVGLPTVLVLWVLRILASLYRSNRDRSDDAQERIAMLSAFLALQASGQVKEEERAVVLQALFRPFSAGPEETLPSPVWEAVMKRIDAGGGKVQ